MNKYYVITVQKDKKYFSYVEVASDNSNNILDKFYLTKCFPVAIDAYDNQKEADAIATDYNNSYIHQDKYLF